MTQQRAGCCRPRCSETELSTWNSCEPTDNKPRRSHHKAQRSPTNRTSECSKTFEDILRPASPWRRPSSRPQLCLRLHSWGKAHSWDSKPRAPPCNLNAACPKLRLIFNPVMSLSAAKSTNQLCTILGLYQKGLPEGSCGAPSRWL